jgi:hypothetical protein
MFSSKPLVFISYSRKDKEKVVTLSRRLSSHGVRTWLDTHDIVGGEWRREIARGLRQSNFFVACLSGNTVQRGEVLQYEYDSALEIQRQRLEGEIYIIPVRLEPCEVPDCFMHLQYMDVYEQAGWDSLIRALRSKSRPRPVLAVAAAVAMAAVLAAVGGYMWLRPTPQSELLAARVKGKAAIATGSVQLGVTLWKMEPSQNSDPSGVREIVHPEPSSQSGAEPKQWTPVRLPTGAIFHLGDHFQVGIESSRSGYLYVINRSFRKDGSTGPASLIFPTNRIRAGENQIWPGRMVRLPDRDSVPPYWELDSSRSDYAGELVIVLLAPGPIEGLDPKEEAFPVADDVVADWNKQFGAGVRFLSYESQQRRLTVEEADARDRGALLSRTAPSPEYIFEADRGPNAAVLGTLKIPVGGRP